MACPDVAEVSEIQLRTYLENVWVCHVAHALACCGELQFTVFAGPANYRIKRFPKAVSLGASSLSPIVVSLSHDQHAFHIRVECAGVVEGSSLLHHKLP